MGSGEDGLGADRPISYDAVRPSDEILEREIPVAGPAYYPWGHPHGYPYAPHPVGGVADAPIEGFTRLGIGVGAGGPVAIVSGAYGHWRRRVYRVFGIQGCKDGSHVGGR